MAKIKKRQLPGVASTEPRAYEAVHAGIARGAAAEGVVLLENRDHLLPLAKGRKVAVFGAGAAQTIKGGTGSGDVNERRAVTIAQGMAHAGFEITTEGWLRDFGAQYAQSRLEWKQKILSDVEKFHDAGEMFDFFMAYTANQYSMPAGAPVYKTDTDVAIFAIARVAGEGADRHAQKKDYDLSDEEYKMLSDLCASYPNVIVIVNAGGVMDLSFMDEFPAIKALLVVSQPGMEGGNAVADVLCGAVCPSGKLTDTWAYHYEDYPNAATFSHNNGNVQEELYQEGLYVGYRYFDSFGVPVRYGFGFGLSYTEFDIKATEVTANGSQIEVRVSVKNVGTVPGKEVVQVYAALPDGRLEKEARRLVAFAKTETLAPEESEELTLSFGADQMESYDEAAAVWILEKGTYGILVGNSLQGAALCGALVLDEEKTLAKTTNICPLQREITCISVPKQMREARDAALREACQSVPQVTWDLSEIPTRVVDYSLREEQDAASALVERLTEEQLIQLATGDPGKGQGSALGSAGVSVPGSAGETSSCAVEQGIANIVLADGPAGLRLNQHYYVQNGRAQMPPFEMSLEHGFFAGDVEPEGEKYYQFCTAFPVGTMLAQTWNMPLLEKVGDAVGQEMIDFGVQLWLAPGMNIHRNPLCGRNFEYYAEDPLVSGKCAAAITRGVQSHPGIGTTIKHFACNNQEDNRMGSDSILTERTLREIYLKGFEIAVRESQPYAIMTSYNLINGVHSANHYDLCTKAARCEFGFRGVIMTDWTTTNIDANCTAAGCMRAGNDLVMPGMPMDHENIRRELEAGTLSVAELKGCITRLVRIILKSNCYEEETATE
jgi:beta-glucosidase